jgi:hypothetical protein
MFCQITGDTRTQLELQTIPGTGTARGPLFQINQQSLALSPSLHDPVKAATSSTSLTAACQRQMPAGGLGTATGLPRD